MFDKEIKYVLPPKDIKQGLLHTKLIIFDWDGVFYSGYKLGNTESSFSEIDSMGINLLRFGYWLLNKEFMPAVIVSGQKNPSANFFGKREYFNLSFYQVKHKVDVAKKLTEIFGFQPHEMLFFFDDVLDISLAKIVGLRYLIPKIATRLFVNEAINNKWCDVVASQDGGNHAIRELSEISLNMLGIYKQVLEHRIEYSETYKEYIEAKKQIKWEEYAL